MSVYKVLKTDDEFLTAAMSQKRVTIFERRGDLAGCIVDYGGPVEKYTPASIKIAGAHYFRCEFEFRMILA
ncbi:hypothetical protein [Paenibacillus sp. NFR01]|uniref:hypothetical protein n=1 Tax=Paenibacillus sp. NFR01 TaxID=1566279 RepID=UPI0008B17DB1|nr:hypothetical protein [Paenibacillus sp. NFR01]SEU32864.1 hypothetical protein SAMN03159358_0165 [Paenibacillus sp. NFR01]